MDVLVEVAYFSDLASLYMLRLTCKIVSRLFKFTFYRDGKIVKVSGNSDDIHMMKVLILAKKLEPYSYDTLHWKLGDFVWIIDITNLTTAHKREKFRVLRMAIDYGNIDVVEFMHYKLGISLGENSKYRDLKSAVIRKDIRMAEWMFQNMMPKNIDKLELFYDACSYGGVQSVKWVYEKFDIKLDIRHHEYENRDVENVYITDFGNINDVDLRVVGRDSCKILKWAISIGYIADWKCWLLIAVKRKAVNIINFILETYRVDLHFDDDALFKMCCMTGNLKMMKFINNFDGRVNFRKVGCLFLWFASKYNHPSIVKWLLKTWHGEIGEDKGFVYNLLLRNMLVRSSCKTLKYILSLNGKFDPELLKRAKIKIARHKQKIKK